MLFLVSLSSLLRSFIPARYRPFGYLEHLTRTRTKSRVRSGPFTGMRYLSTSVGSAYIPKLLGTYESELRDQIEAICSLGSDRLVDIGAAEGYYAIGLAVRNPSTMVVAFETEPAGQAAIHQMAALNHVSNQVEVRGKCEPTDLAAALEGATHPAVICDAEGCEERLLDPKPVPALTKAIILAELHDFLVPGVTETLTSRFRATHRLHHIWQQPRSAAQFPWRTFGTTLLPRSYLDWTVSEWRPERMSWLWMQPYA